MNMIGKRYLYFAISLLVIIPGMLALIIWGLPLAIDFTGGSVLEVKFESGVLPQDAQVIALYNDFNYPDAQVQTSGTDQLIIRTKDMPEATK
ncbi:protein translocase subunit SecF, partial [bacterium]